MATPRSAWGIDIGNRGLKAVKLTRSGDDIKIDDVDFIEHETVLSQAGDNREALINSALATFVSRRNIKGAVVSVGVAGGSSFARFIKLPPVEEKRLPEIVRFEAIQQIPFPLDEVEWSYQLFKQPDNPEVEVGIFAMRKDLVNAFVKYFTDVDLNVQAVQMNPLAVYNAMQRDGRLADGISMILDIGADNTDLLIAGEDSVWHRSIPIGGNSFTETLMKAFKVSFAKAEDLKRTAATSKYQRQIFSAMRPVFADLVAEIQRSIGFYGSTNRDQTISRLYAIGGTTKLTPLQKYLQQNLQMDVVKLENFAALPPTDGKASGELLEHMPSLHAAYGLALQALGEGKITSSLLPTAIRREKMWKDKTRWFAAAAAIAACAALVPVGRLFMDRAAFAANATKREESSRVASRAKELADKWSQVESVGGAEMATVKNVMSLVNNRAVWADILTEITAAVPRPAPELAKALVERNAASLKAVPRNQRAVFRIESIQSRYLADVGPILRDTGNLGRHAGELTGVATTGRPAASAFSPGFGGPQGFAPPTGIGGEDLAGSNFGGGQPAAPVVESTGETAQRGFLVRIRVISPRQGADNFINSNFIPALNKVAPNAAQPIRLYAFQKAEVTRSTTLFNDPELIRRIEAEFAASRAADTQLAPVPGQNGGNFPGGFQPGFNPGAFQGEGGPMGVGEDLAGSQPGSQPGFQPGGFSGGVNPNDADSDPEDPRVAAFKDKLTGEDVRSDQIVDVMFLIVLDPPAFVPPAEAPAQ